MKKILGLGLLLFSIQALACTGFLAGKDATADGSMMYARNEDLSGVNPKKFMVVEAKKYKKGEMFVNPDTGFKWPYPQKALKHTLVPDADPSYGVFGEAGINELGVSISATVSASANDEILKLDPYVEGGLTEPDVASLVLMQAKTARHAVEIIAEIVEKAGAGEGNVIVFADKNEMWYMEIYTGHQYVAVKVPTDVYAVVPNAFYLGSYDFNSKDVISSKDIQKLPESNGLAKTVEGKFHLALTYREEHGKYNYDRIAMGQNYFCPLLPVAHDGEMAYELFRKPDKKISVKDVMNFLRYRYEGTDYDVDTPENKGKIRAIGTDTNLEAHIFQIRENAPTVMWLAMGTVEHSVFVPYYEYITKTHKSYTADADSYNRDSMYWAMKGLHILAREDRIRYGLGVKTYWDKVENDFITKLKEEDEMINKKTGKARIEYANKLGLMKAEQVKKDADKMFDQLIYFKGNMTDMALQGKKKDAKFEYKK
ncbi:C69 family dipeptidase [Streptobacillus felis]|uniref:Dipeptidase n=1 Tax=Streptobacillus felis TaxID=1384509 RepID=A0A7Z0PFE6_9FUSO|nr:C69 family dipeptidase [Streptobacillus felis]NYV27738.1 C69 family dipeptidase [Streptobacillus felis]